MHLASIKREQLLLINQVLLQSGQCSLPQPAWEDRLVTGRWRWLASAMTSTPVCSPDGDTSNMSGPEYLLSGYEPLSEVREEGGGEEAEEHQGIWNPWSRQSMVQGTPLHGRPPTRATDHHLHQAEGGSAPSSSRETSRLARLEETWSSLSMRMSRADWKMAGQNQRDDLSWQT